MKTETLQLGQVKGHVVHAIERGKLPSGSFAWIGYCKIAGRRIRVASTNKEPGSWFSL